jgi:hypothetical protein
MIDPIRRSSHVESRARLAGLVWPLLFLGAGHGMTATAGPSVGQVLAACDRGAALGGRGVDSAMCEWYAAPCDCKAGPPEGPRWCTPDGEPVERIAIRVVAELRRLPDRSVDVDLAVPGILARLYPCPASGEPGD